MVSMFSEIEIIRGHRFDSEQDAPCGCWGLCHCGAKQCMDCSQVFSYGPVDTDCPMNATVGDRECADCGKVPGNLYCANCIVSLCRDCRNEHHARHIKESQQ